MDDPLLWLGTLACATLAALGLVPLKRHRVRLAALCLALVLAPALILADNWGSDRLDGIRDRPLLALLGIVLAAIGLIAVATILRRRPGLLAPALVAAMPFRIPVDLGGGSSNLLIPLYALIAAGLLAAAWAEWREPATTAEPGDDDPADRERGWLRHIGLALAAFVVLYALQAGYADELTPALQNVAFFLAPFSALFYLISTVRWDRNAVRAVVLVLAAEGLIFALVGGYQYLTGELFWNEKVISGNEAHAYFRVNSLFWDPNILGRYVAVTMVTMAAVVAFGRRPREIRAATALFCLLLVLLVLSFSQTSTLALLGGLLVLLAARWGVAAGVAASIATAIAIAASIVLIGGGGLSSETTSGRAGLIDGGLEIAADRPLIGFGSGSFEDEFTERYYQGEGFAAESHTEPVTSAAEGGVVGLAAYLAVLVVTLGGLLAATGLSIRTPARGTPLAATLLAIYSLMVVHSLGYAAFFIDPITWVVLAIAAGALVPATLPLGRRQPA